VGIDIKHEYLKAINRLLAYLKKVFLHNLIRA